jgi:hypothetical protein
VDALDAFQPALQLDLVFAHLGFQRRHDGAQPVVDIAVDQLEGARTCIATVSKKRCVSPRLAVVTMLSRC